MPAMTKNAREWEQKMLLHGDLASNLLAFAGSQR
jgi:hypothetical protein